MLAQYKDEKRITHKDIDVKTKKAPSKKLINDMIFAYTVSKYLNSNAIVVAQNLSTIGIGSGQTSRLDAKRTSYQKNEEKR